MNDDILSLIKCKCNCSGCAGICQNDACRNDGTCRRLFQYIQGDFIYGFSITDDVVKQLVITHRDKDNNELSIRYSVIWNLDRKETKIHVVKFTYEWGLVKNVSHTEFTINSLISPFNISPERIQKLLIFS